MRGTAGILVTLLAGCAAADRRPSGEPPLLAVGRRVECGAAASSPYFGPGWSWPEGSFRWAQGPRAEVAFALEVSRPLLLRLRLEPYVKPRNPRQRVAVFLNGRG